MQTNIKDISEDEILNLMPEVLDTLLRDHTLSGTDPSDFRHISWMTHDYESLGKGFAYDDEITADHITGEFCEVIQPRILKSKKIQRERIRDKAEVFTPSWICNAQNNLIDDAWFGRKNVFNVETPDHDWVSTVKPIKFPKGKYWWDYTHANRMEVACGEGPYITSRYDTVTGDFIPANRRIGILDRKLRIVCEHCHTTRSWIQAAKSALHATYGFEWQGDSLLLAREAALYTTIEYFLLKFDRLPKKETINHWAYIISWNLWQMDGLTKCVPGTKIPCMIRDWTRWQLRKKHNEPDYRGELFMSNSQQEQKEPSLF